MLASICNYSFNMKLFITTFWCPRDERYKGKSVQSLDANDWMTERRMGSEIILREITLIVTSATNKEMVRGGSKY